VALTIGANSKIAASHRLPPRRRAASGVMSRAWRAALRRTELFRWLWPARPAVKLAVGEMDRMSATVVDVRRRAASRPGVACDSG
jgi:hypothetical protein